MKSKISVTFLIGILFFVGQLDNTEISLTTAFQKTLQLIGFVFVLLFLMPERKNKEIFIPETPKTTWLDLWEKHKEKEKELWYKQVDFFLTLKGLKQKG